MSESKENGKVTASQIDAVKWVFCVLLLAASGYVFYGLLSSYGLIYKVLALIPFWLVILFLVFSTGKGRFALALLAEAVKESKRVVWPTPNETNQTTLVVMGVVVAAAFALWLVDILLNWATSTMVG